MQTKRDDLNNAKPRFRTAFNYDAKKASTETGLTFTQPSRTQQHQRDDTDINVIVQRFAKTGVLPTSGRTPEYGDFHGPSDYHEALNIVIEAQDAFDSLPSKTRAHFKGDPAAFLAFIEAGPDAQMLLDLGLGHMVSPPRETPVDTTPAPLPATPPAPAG